MINGVIKKKNAFYPKIYKLSIGSSRVDVCEFKGVSLIVLN